MVRRAACGAVLIVIWIIVLFHLLETSIALLVPRPFLPYSGSRKVEQAGVYGHKRYYVLIEEHGFRELTHSRELQEHCQDFLQVDRMVKLYIEDCFKEINALQWGSDFETDDSDEDYKISEDEDTGNDEDDQSLEGEDGRGDENDRGRGDKGTGDGGTEDAGNRSDKGIGAKGAEEAGDSDFSRKDSDYEEEHDDEEYEENVDHEAQWLGVAKQRQIMAERAKKTRLLRLEEMKIEDQIVM
ncbi:hypothetical protein ACH5RR_036078 [Cinchona calisaya]|uniref:Uncharacterized protein n=1 Tax=Cinchona calisaya TaxID=153742 RepID=A0ABD2Y259_9GENT